MKEIPSELDWVKKRAECSLKQVFSELHRGVMEDVQDANIVLPSSPVKPPFEVIDGRGGKDFVVQRHESIKPTVTFILFDDHIAISSSVSGENWAFTVGLNDEGRCQLRSNSEEYEQWQVRKMALEALFFPITQRAARVE